MVTFSENHFIRIQSHYYLQSPFLIHPLKLKRKRIILKGAPEISVDRPAGCRFQSRCPIGFDRELCKEEEPILKELESGHWVSCHYPGELTIT